LAERQYDTMTDYRKIYRSEAAQYDRLIEREDYQGNLLPAMQKLIRLEGLKVVESGAGTGRLTCMLAPEADSILAMDRSVHMLDAAREHLAALEKSNWSLAACDHRQIPAPNKCADLVVSGWSVAYLTEEGGTNWREEVDQALREMERVLKPGGLILLLETLGTGFEQPNPPEHLEPYLEYLEEIGFERHWLRTDYRFESLEEAEELCGFFFGRELAEKVREKEWVVLPECTGIWSRKKA